MLTGLQIEFKPEMEPKLQAKLDLESETSDLKH